MTPSIPQYHFSGDLVRTVHFLQALVISLLPLPHHRVSLHRLVHLRLTVVLRLGSSRALRVQLDDFAVKLLESFTRQLVGHLLLVTAVALVHRPVLAHTYRVSATLGW